MSSRFFLISFTALTLPLSAQDYQAEILQRAKGMIDTFARRGPNSWQVNGPHRAGRNGFWFAEAKFFRGHDQTANETLLKVLHDAPGKHDAGGANGGFSLWPGMDAYVRWEHKLTPEVKQAYFDTYTNCTTFGKGATPNQRIMAAVGCRLACEVWGTDVVTKVSGITFRNGPKDDRSGKKWLLSHLEEYPKYNCPERWSKHYLWANINPIRTLADLSTDGELRNRADMVSTYVIANAASTWFKGHWALPAGRGRTDGSQVRNDLTEYTWNYLFGGAPSRGTIDGEQSLPYMLPKSRLPEAFPEIYEAATKRTQPYTVRTFARGHETQFATSYVAPGYALYSQVDADTTLNVDGSLVVKDFDNNGVPSNDWSAERWVLVWDDAPDYESAAIMMRPPTSYGWAKGSGISPYEDTLQSEGTLLLVYNIPEGKHQYTRDTIPTKCLASVDESQSHGRLFIHYKNLLVCIWRTDHFQWGAEKTPVIKSGTVIETASPVDYAQATPQERIAAFRNDVLTKCRFDASEVKAERPRLRFTNLKGNSLDMTYGEAGRINAAPVDYEQWPMQDDPWVKMPQMGNMFITGKDRTVMLNFKNWTQSINTRPRLSKSDSAKLLGDTVDINLASRVTDQETSAAQLHFTVYSASGGTATLLADGHTARFVKEKAAGGETVFDFTVADSAPDHRLIFHYDYEDAVSAGHISDASTNERHATPKLYQGKLAPARDVPPVLAATSKGALRLAPGAGGTSRLMRHVYPGNVNLSNNSWTFATWFKREDNKGDDILFTISPAALVLLGKDKAAPGKSQSGAISNPAPSDELMLIATRENGILLTHRPAITGPETRLTSANSAPAGGWHHIALCNQRTAYHRGIMHVYLDGKHIGQTGDLALTFDQSAPLLIGGAAQTVGTAAFAGLLDDTALYRGHLTAQDITRLATGSVAHLGGLTISQRVIIEP
jgi:Concanavalin A-like lectin/glucanases superfamily